MILRTILSFFAVCFLLCGSAPQANALDVKDSYYFMKDDNEFSDEEKDEEAQYVFEMCNYNILQRTYFDCACLAGAFRQERDKEELIPQNNIINMLLTKDTRGCANTVGIAGETYRFCTEYAESFRYREKNNEEYCECVANQTARKFSKNPRMNMNYVTNIRVDALSYCRKNLREYIQRETAKKDP